jgi:hypothetical protein
MGAAFRNMYLLEFLDVFKQTGYILPFIMNMIKFKSDLSAAYVHQL